MKEREAYRQMKRSGKQVMKAVGSDDIMETLNKWEYDWNLSHRYSAMKGIEKRKFRGSKRNHD